MGETAGTCATEANILHFHTAVTPCPHFPERKRETTAAKECSAANPVSGANWVDYSVSTGSNTANVSVTTYCWHVTATYPFDQAVDQWIPAPLSQIRTDYSLHIYDPDATSITDVVTEQDFLTVYPNPADNLVWTSFIMSQPASVNIQILNVTGQVLQNVNKGYLPIGSHLFNFDVGNLANGVYFVQLTENAKTITRKLSVMH